jgi:hypothetical protein
MDLNIHSIQNHGDQTKEFIDLVASVDCEIGDYQLADTTYTAENVVSNKLRHVYWLPNKNIKAGEYVRVFTGAGTPDTVKSSNGTVIHKLFWGLREGVWNDKGDSALLMKITQWQHFKVA